MTPSTIGHSSGSRPTHVEDTELQVVERRDLTQRATEVIGQQGRNNAETHKTDAHIEAALERFANVTEYLFHFID